MSRINFQKRVQLRRYTALAVMMLFALRAAVPVGFMPASAAQAAEGLVFVMCPAQGPQPIPHLPSNSDSPHASKATGCSFAASALAIATPDEGAPNQASYSTVFISAVEKTRHTAATFVFLPEARAPPSFLG